MSYCLDWKEYARVARAVLAEGCVLLKNDEEVLPLCTQEVVSIFGRCQINTYYSGTGSGGLVNLPYAISVLDGLRNSDAIKVNEELAEIYSGWIKENPFDKGKGWAQEPWCQKEMPLTQEIVRKAFEKSNTAIVVIGRTAGEDKDNSVTKGSYMLSIEEENMIALVTSVFSKVVVLLNVGNIIDMSWVDKYNPQGVLYVWHGGCECGNAVAEVLTGKVNPSGKLSDTIANDIKDYPSTPNYGNSIRNYYEEDIYVGYRYFETFKPNKVRYPFGFGLSYTKFKYICENFKVNEYEISFAISVTNIGSVVGKEVIQVYGKQPQGILGKPTRNLISFEKTKALSPGESDTLYFSIPIKNLASYDDSGITGFRSSWILEAGDYNIYVGNDVRSATLVDTYHVEKVKIIEKLNEALAPVVPLNRIKPSFMDGKMCVREEMAPIATVELNNRIKENIPDISTYTGNKGYLLADVYKGSISLEEFLVQLTDEELIWMTRGEGMCSPKVTPGTAGAFGGVTKELKDYGIPVVCCADGPSGIRMDTGEKAFSMPIATALACSFNTSLVKELFECLGAELRVNKIDTILGPGMNIHRNPLNGRNFEYFSEDPYLTGKMVIAELEGMKKYGVTGTLKHFACNNQEYERKRAEAVVSERALREIYLKPFEMAVKEGEAYSIMSTYGPINGSWTASNYDLLTTILRKQWGYEGLVMTDWWAQMNEGEMKASIENTGAMIRAQNDVFMVVANAKENSNNDNSFEYLKSGKLTRGELIRGAANICRFIMKSPAMEREITKKDVKWEILNEPKGEIENSKLINYGRVKMNESLDVSDLSTEGGTAVLLGVELKQKAHYTLIFKLKVQGSDIAQVPMTVFVNEGVVGTISMCGTKGKSVEKRLSFDVWTNINNYIKLFFRASGMIIEEIRIVQGKSLI